MKKIIPTAGFLTLSVMVLWLFSFTVYEAWVLHSLGGIFVIIVLFGLILQIQKEYQKLATLPTQEHITRKAFANFIVVFLGAIAAYTLSISLELGAVVAASLVGLLAGLVLPAYGVPIYCGAFVGMTSVELFATHGELAVAGAVAGFVYVLTTAVFGGFGGKLGTIAFTGSVITGLGLEREFLIAPTPGWHTAWLIVAYAVIAATATYAISITLKHGPVIASSVVGLIGGLVLPALHPEMGSTAAVMVICASFAGMSSKQHFPHILQMTAAGLITGMIFIYSTPLMGGAGGKLGTIAFGSVMAVRGYLNHFDHQRPHT